MRGVLRSLLSLALPPRCPACGQVVRADGQLCSGCWQELDFLTGAGCTRCGTPLPFQVAICAPCLARPPDHDGCRAAVSYGDIARNLALRLKNGRRIGLAEFMARLVVPQMPDEPGLLVPVPAHRWRILRRGFNQSLLIARQIASQRSLPIALDVLVRTRSTPMLRGANARQRARLVRGVFAVPDAARAILAGQTVYLVDDVYTSGATANACARALKRAGARKVIVLCWARVLKNGPRD